MNRKMVLVLVFSLALLLSGTFPEISIGEGEAEGCLKCHQGIESIGEDHEDLDCEDCHLGDPDGDTEEAAHTGIYSNPGDLTEILHKRLDADYKRV